MPTFMWTEMRWCVFNQNYKLLIWCLANCFNEVLTKDIPIEDVQVILPSYNLYPMRVEPSHCGHSAVSRSRVYIYCCHKETCEYMFDVWEAYAAICEQVSLIASTRCRDYFVASQRERDLHAWHICRKRKIDWQQATCQIWQVVFKLCWHLIH